jgi:hypothetical protein
VLALALVIDILQYAHVLVDSAVRNVSPALRDSSVQLVSLVLRIARNVIRACQDQVVAWILQPQRSVIVRMDVVVLMESVLASLAGAHLAMEQNVLSVCKVFI